MNCKWCEKELTKGIYCHEFCQLNYLEKRVEILEQKLEGHSAFHLREKGLNEIADSIEKT